MSSRQDWLNVGMGLGGAAGFVGVLLDVNPEKIPDNEYRAAFAVLLVGIPALGAAAGYCVSGWAYNNAEWLGLIGANTDS